ncbi:hypothetical protein Dimus_000804 [Dionaea muscipula]
MDQMMARLRAMYRSSGSELLERIEAHRASPTRSAEQEQQAHQSTPASSGASEQARLTTQEPEDIPVEEDQPILLRIVPLSQIVLDDEK